MRIGTWNLDARWDERHLALMVSQRCDVWLLAEVIDRVAVPGFARHVTVDRSGRTGLAASWLVALRDLLVPDACHAATVPGPPPEYRRMLVLRDEEGLSAEVEAWAACRS